MMHILKTIGIGLTTIVVIVAVAVLVAALFFAPAFLIINVGWWWAFAYTPTLIGLAYFIGADDGRY